MLYDVVRDQTPGVAAVRVQRPKAEPAMCLLDVHVKIRSRRECMVWIYGEPVKKFRDKKYNLKVDGPR
jgi:hypothetical protein